MSQICIDSLVIDHALNFFKEYFSEIEFKVVEDDGDFCVVSFSSTTQESHVIHMVAIAFCEAYNKAMLDKLEIL